MSFQIRRFGAAEVFALCDGIGPFFHPRADAFPQATSERWEAADRLDPDAAGPDGTWILHFHCYAIRFDNGTTALVDAGIGPAEAPAASWAPVPGRLPEELARAGIAPDEVDLVAITHVHTDHIGWSVTAQKPYFPNARYVLQREEVAALERVRSAALDAVVRPLQRSGQLDLLDGESTLAAGLTAVPTPGHTPGHQCVLLASGAETVAMTGDLVLHAVQLVDPAIGYEIDQDQNRARESRLGLLRDLRGRPSATLATSHPTEPFHAVN